MRIPAVVARRRLWLLPVVLVLGNLLIADSEVAIPPAGWVLFAAIEIVTAGAILRLHARTWSSRAERPRLTTRQALAPAVGSTLGYLLASLIDDNLPLLALQAAGVGVIAAVVVLRPARTPA